jgi:antitoxin StbD
MKYDTIFNTEKGVTMQPILANFTASITELKKSPTQLLKDAGDEAVAILNHNVASAYLVPSSLYEKMIDDYQLSQIVKERLNDGEEAIRVKLDDL